MLEKGSKAKKREGGAARRVQVVIADEDERFTTMLTEWLGREGYQGHGAQNVAEAMKLLRRPREILVADLDMRGNADGEFVKAVRRAMPDLPIIVVTRAPSVESAVMSLRLACVDYLVKPVQWWELRRALNVAFVRRGCGSGRRPGGMRGRIAGRGFETLSFQERRVVLLVAQGKTNKEISGELQLSEKTVKNYLNRVFSKLQISRRAQAAAMLAGITVD
jgi:two-component system, NarL family, response regulator DevR